MLKLGKIAAAVAVAALLALPGTASAALGPIDRTYYPTYSGAGHFETFSAQCNVPSTAITCTSAATASATTGALTASSHIDGTWTSSTEGVDTDSLGSLSQRDQMNQAVPALQIDVAYHITQATTTTSNAVVGPKATLYLTVYAYDSSCPNECSAGAHVAFSADQPWDGQADRTLTVVLRKAGGNLPKGSIRVTATLQSQAGGNVNPTSFTGSSAADGAATVTSIREHQI